MRYTLVRQKDPWRQGLANIGDLARQPRRFPNTSTWITPNIPWSWITRRYWQQSPDGLREEWKRPYTSEPSTQASTEMEEGIIYHRYGTTSSRREWRQTGRGGGGPRHHRPAQRPRQHHRDVLTDEADSRRRKLLWVDFILSWVLSVQRTVLMSTLWYKLRTMQI